MNLPMDAGPGPAIGSECGAGVRVHGGVLSQQGAWGSVSLPSIAVWLPPASWGQVRAAQRQRQDSELGRCR